MAKTTTQQRVAATLAARARVLDHLVAHFPGVDRDQARETLIAVNADGYTGLRNLDAHLQANPDALVAGSPECPTVLVRLVQHLAARGFAVVLVPCAGCGRTDKPLPLQGTGGRICDTCWVRDPARHEPCARCGKRRRPQKRQPDGSALCSSCHANPQHRCSGCGQVDIAAARGPDGPLCPRCYESTARPRRRCGQCGEVRVINKRAPDGDRELCKRCNHTIAQCSRCGRRRPCRRITTGQPVCRSCVDVPTPPCARCGRPRPVSAHWPIGGVCRDCYRTTRADPQLCPSCGHIRPLIGRDAAGRDACGPCSGADVDYACRTCGSGAEELYHQGRCVRCVAAERLRRKFADDHGEVPAALQPLLDSLERAERARSVLEWLRRDNSGAEILRGLVGRNDISHDALDALSPGHAVIALRAMLVHLGILPKRNEALAAVDAWVERTVRALPEHHRRIIGPYAHWSVLRSARHRAEHKRFTEHSGARARMLINVAISLLNWADERSISLAELTQSDVDEWLHAGGIRLQSRHFLRWARRRRLVGELDLPRYRGTDPQDFLTEDDYGRVLQRCLHDQDVPLDVRVAGALVLVFGLHVARIVELTTDDLGLGDEPQLRINGHNLVLPPALGTLLDQHVATATTTSLVDRSGTPANWLFPGQHAGRPLAGASLVSKLVAHEIPARISRNSALLNLASDLPAAVLSSLLGLSETAAVRWVHRTKRDWHAFLQVRARDRSEHRLPGC